MITGPIKLTIHNPALTGRESLPGGTSTTPPKREKASLLTKAKRAAAELAKWAKEGAVLVPAEIERARWEEGCAKCLYWDPAGNLGLGECGAPGCGCTRVKLKLATSFCPLNPPKWGRWNPPA